MGRQQNFYQVVPEKRADHKIHPVWRGIGFVFIIFVPILSCIGSYVLLDENTRQNWFSIPPEFLTPAAFQSGVTAFFNYLSLPPDAYSLFLDPLLFVKIGLTLAIIFIVFILFQLVSFLLYRSFGPSRYGPLDAPPIKAKVRKHSR